MLNQQRVSVVQFIERDANLQVTLRQRHILVHLKSVVEVANLAKVVQELVDSRLVVLDERVERDHVSFLGIRRLVGQILQHFRNLKRLSGWLCI